MPVAPTPFGDHSIESPQALAPRLAPHLPVSAPRPSPVHREPQKIERARPLPTALSRLGALERNEPSLLRMQPQSEPLHPLAQHLRSRTDDHRSSAPAPPSHLALEPHVQCVMQQVPQQRLWEPYDYLITTQAKRNLSAAPASAGCAAPRRPVGIISQVEATIEPVLELRQISHTCEPHGRCRTRRS